MGESLKKKKKEIKKNVSGVHVMLENPKFARKQILSYAIDVLQVIQRYETLKNIKKEKDNVYNKLRDMFYDLKDIESKLVRSHVFPSLESLGLIEHKVEEQREIKPPSVVDFKESKEINENLTYDSEIERLKSELKDIDEKLKHL